MTPLVALSLARSIEMDWQPIMGLHLVLLLVLAWVVKYRARLSVWIKAATMQWMFFIIAIAGILKNNSLDIGVGFLFMSIVVSMAFFHRNKAIVFLVFIIIIELLLSYYINDAKLTIHSVLIILSNLVLAGFIMAMINFMFNELAENVELLKSRNIQLDRAKNMAELSSKNLATEMFKKESFLDEIAEKNIELQTAIAEKIRAESQLKHLAMYDKVTNIPNRNFLQNEAHKLIKNCKRHGQKCAILFIDLDGFKQVNDNNSHKTGDVVLLDIALRVSDVIRDIDVFGRYGGDEFIIVLPNYSNEEEINAVANRVIDEIKKPIESVDIEESIGSSIGIALYPNDAENYEVLFEYADAAMYKAKKEGGNRYAYHMLS